jgi:hypothetical protein
MSSVRRGVTRGVIALTAGAAAILWSGDLPPRDSGGWISTAEAVLGAPATPLSVGGVARRTTRRTVAGAGAAPGVGAAGVGAAGAAAARPGGGVGGVGGAGAPGGGAGVNRAGRGR